MNQLTTELASQLYTQLSCFSTDLIDCLTNTASNLYSSYFDGSPAKSSQTEEELRLTDEKFTVILPDSELLFHLQQTTRKAMIDVKQYEKNLCNMINKLTKTNADHFDVILKVIQSKIGQQINWAKTSVKFGALEHEDLILLLKNSWSSNLLLDSLYQRIHDLPDQITLDNGEKFNLLTLALFGNDSLLTELELEDLQQKLVKLKFDYIDFVCTKILLLLDLDLTRLESCELKKQQAVHEFYEQALSMFGDYVTWNYCQVPDKFDRLLHEIIPEIKSMAWKKLEMYLVTKYRNGHSIPILILDLLNGKNHIERGPRATRAF